MLGINLAKVHIILKFKQYDWLKKYIDFNTDKIKIALSSFKNNFLKLMNNSDYGKIIKFLRKRVKSRLVNNATDYKKYVSKPSFVSQNIFSKNLVAIHQTKPVLILDKAIYVGFSILNLHKLLITNTL